MSFRKYLISIYNDIFSNLNQFALAGTIGSEPEPIESRQFSSKDKIATAGIFGSGSKGKHNDTGYPPTPQPPGSTVPFHPPTTDENMIYGITYYFIYCK